MDQIWAKASVKTLKYMKALWRKQLAYILTDTHCSCTYNIYI